MLFLHLLFQEATYKSLVASHSKILEEVIAKMQAFMSPGVFCKPGMYLGYDQVVADRPSIAVKVS
jgi:hypothetical protein